MQKKTNRKTNMQMIRKCMPLYIMMLPCIVYLIINNYGVSQKTGW